MSSYVVAIPSYDRVDTLKTKTMALLERNAIPKTKIHIFVANKEEEVKYKTAFPDYKVIVGVKGLLNQRNFMTDYFKEGAEIVYMDDDVMEIKEKKSADKASRELVDVDLKVFFPLAFKALKDNKRFIWGLAPVLNAFYMTRTISTDVKFIYGNCYGVINRHDKDLKLSLATSSKEDVERSLRFAQKDGGTLRFNYIGAKTRMYAPGGLVSEGFDKATRIRQSKDVVETLIKAFPGYGTMKQRPNGMYEFVFKRKPDVKGGSSEEDDLKIEQLPIRNKKEYETARDELLAVLRDTTIPKILKSTIDKDTGKVKVAQRDLIIGTIGRTMNFGWGRTRHGYKDYVTNERNPELFKALVRFGNAVVPEGWTYQSITLNHGVRAKKHIDGQNNGRSVIVGIGNYTGGKLNIYQQDGSKPKAYTVKNKPTMFNGAVYPHATQPFEGERYTIIFFKQAKPGGVKGITMRGGGDEGLVNPGVAKLG